MTNKEYIKYLLDAKTPCIWIKTYEEARVVEDLREIAFEYKEDGRDFSLNVWSITEGLINMPVVDTDEEKPPSVSHKNPDNLFASIKESQTSKVPRDIIWVLRDLDKIFANVAFLTRHIRDLKEYGGTESYQPLVITSITGNVPKDLDKLVTVLDYDTLSEEDIESMVNQFISNIAETYSFFINISAEEKENIVKTLRGFTYIEIVTLLRKNYIKEGTLSYSFMADEKVKMIQKTDVLKFKVSQINLSSMGGNDNFKEWISLVKTVFNNSAKEYGCSPLKGYLAFGIPGSAKTMSAEALAGELHIPFIKFDSSKILSKLVGESEKNIEEALRLVKASAPCVFLIDEVEKILGGK